MGRDNRIRLSDVEKSRLERVREEKYSETVAADISVGAVVGDLAEEELDRLGVGDHE